MSDDRAFSANQEKLITQPHGGNSSSRHGVWKTATLVLRPTGLVLSALAFLIVNETFVGLHVVNADRQLAQQIAAAGPKSGAALTVAAEAASKIPDSESTGSLAGSFRKSGLAVRVDYIRYPRPFSQFAATPGD
jgi:hypothetical protein